MLTLILPHLNVINPFLFPPKSTKLFLSGWYGDTDYAIKPVREANIFVYCYFSQNKYMIFDGYSLLDKILITKNNKVTMQAELRAIMKGLIHTTQQPLI